MFYKVSSKKEVDFTFFPYDDKEAYYLLFFFGVMMKRNIFDKSWLQLLPNNSYVCMLKKSDAMKVFEFFLLTDEKIKPFLQIGTRGKLGSQDHAI